MGTTTKGLRYPEATVLGNTLHTRIKELADDTNAALVSRDTRFDGLDTKTNTTNSTLAIRGVPLTRNGSYTPTTTNMPNDNVARTTQLITGIVVIPSNATYVQVSMQQAAHCVANAQCWWDPQISLNNGATSWLRLFPTGNVPSHNQGNPALNMGYAVAGIFDVTASRGQTIALAVNCTVDPGSGAWVHIGYLHWTVTIMA